MHVSFGKKGSWRRGIRCDPESKTWKKQQRLATTCAGKLCESSSTARADEHGQFLRGERVDGIGDTGLSRRCACGRVSCTATDGRAGRGEARDADDAAQFEAMQEVAEEDAAKKGREEREGKGGGRGLEWMGEDEALRRQ